MQSHDKPYISLNPCFFVYFGFGIPHSVVNLWHSQRRFRKSRWKFLLWFCHFSEAKTCFSFRECSRLVDPGGLFFDVVFFLCPSLKNGMFFRCREGIFLRWPTFYVLGIKLGPVASLNHLEVRQKATKTTRKRRSVAWTKRKNMTGWWQKHIFP